MRKNEFACVCVCVCVCLTSATHSHSIQADPFFSPWKTLAVLTMLLQLATPHELSQHLAMALEGGEAAARSMAKKYGLHYVCQVFTDPPVYHLHKPINLTHQPNHEDNHYYYYYNHQNSRKNPKTNHQSSQQENQDYYYNHQSSYYSNHHITRRSNPDLVNLLTKEPGVKWVTQQWGYVREKRDQIYRFKPVFLPINKGSKTTRSYKGKNLRREKLNSLRGLGLSNIRRKMREKGSYSDKKSIFTREFGEGSESRGSGEKKVKNTEDTNDDDDDDDDDDSPVFNDPLYKEQWYLHNTGQLGQGGCDLNLTGVWRRGYTGQGVTLCILDDGFQTTNPELEANYSPKVSYSVVHDGGPLTDPSPRLDPPLFSNSHGTYCAGVAAAVANNDRCGVGVAYGAKVGGVRIVDGTVTDVQEAVSLSRHAAVVDIFSASWGPRDDGTHLEGPGELTKLALMYGVTKGRGGLGSIYVWASGNGGLTGDNCNLDGYASSMYTLTVSALTPLGMSTFYSEPCAATLGGVFVGGRHLYGEGGSVQRDMSVVVPELDGECSNRFQGSSAAAPLMAGVLALLLQANPRLSWRDVQHLVVETAAPTTAGLTEHGWQTNARGKKFHLRQGFGAIDAGRLIDSSLSWQNVGPQKEIRLNMLREKLPVSSGWVNVSKEVGEDVRVKAVEHVVATVTLHHPQRRLINLFIVSPAGTESQVLTHRFQDMSVFGFHGWEFMSVHLWGEKPKGVWKLALKCDSKLPGELIKADLTVYGY